jgi:hypothetical protein
MNRGKMIKKQIGIILIIMIIFVLLYGCSNQPKPDDFQYKLALPDKKYDLAFFRQRGNVYAPEYCYIYMDFRNGKYKQVFTFILNDYAFKMLRIDTNTVAFIKHSRKTEIYDTTYFKLN